MSNPVGDWNTYMRSQMRLEGGRESDVLLEITVPISALEDWFRIGWSIRSERGGRWIALTTGRAQHDIRKPLESATWVALLIDECARLTRGHQYD